jgi:AhpD family alkylhydroperoxidase
MKSRIEYAQEASGGVKALYQLENYVKHSGLEPGLLDLVKTRVSQINGCAYCLDMHTKDARARGEAEQRLYALAAWRETPFFSERERAGLAWAETVTRVAETHVPDEAFEHARQHFAEKELWTSRWQSSRSMVGIGSPSHFGKCPALTRLVSVDQLTSHEEEL